MFDLGWQELFLVALIALVVVGPKQLPTALRTVTQVVRKGRSLANEFRRSFDEVVREAELDDIRDQVRRAGHADLNREAENLIDPEGDMRRRFSRDGQPDERTRRAVEEMNPTDPNDEPGPGPGTNAPGASARPAADGSRGSTE